MTTLAAIGAESNAALDARIAVADRKRLFVLFRDLSQHSSKEWLVHNLLGCGEASAFYGKPGDGKSVLAEDMGLHIAGGLPWHGRPVRRGAVLFIALERPQLVERRAIAFREKYGITDLPFAIARGVHDFRDKRTAEHFIEVARQLEQETGESVALIQTDTLSRALCGGDENSPKDMGAIVNATALLQHGTGAHVQWIHHMPIDSGERMRGHGALLGALDTTVLVAKGHSSRTATVIKANDSEEGARITFGLESIAIDDAETTAPIVVPMEGAETGAASAHPARLPKGAQTGLRALREAVSEVGAVPPAANHVPANVRTVTIEQWRQYAYRMGISAADTTDRAKQLAFKRAVDHLVAGRSVACWDELAWPV